MSKKDVQEAINNATRLLDRPFKLPANLAVSADTLYVTKGARLALQKIVDSLEDREKQLKAQLIDKLPKSQSSGIAGKVARATIVAERVPTVVDWPALYKHVRKTGHFDLLHKRLAGDAARSRWDNKETIPGVGGINVPRVSLEKL